jgi:hypothetical protein
MFRGRAFGEGAINRTNDQLMMIPQPKASRQRQQQLLAATKIPAGVDVRDPKNGGSLWLC